MKHCDTPVTKCPTCGFECDAASCVSDPETEKPVAGDFTLCLKCGEIEVFNEDLTTHLATIAEIMDMSPECSELLTRTQRMIRETRPVP